MQNLHKIYANHLKSLDPLSHEEEVKLVQQWKEEGNPKYLARLVGAHINLVSRIAMGYRGYGLPLHDLVSEGHVGVMHALKNFDTERGFRFSTYASWWIKSAINDYILRMWSLFKFSGNKTHRHLFFKLRKTQNEINRENYHKIEEERTEMIAQRLQVKKEDVQFMSDRLHYRESSLNITKGEGNNEWIQWINDDRTSAEDLILQKEEKNKNRHALRKGMERLNSREFFIIKSRYLTEPHVTLEELAQNLNISRERVRQIEKSALKKLKGSFAEQAPPH